MGLESGPAAARAGAEGVSRRLRRSQCTELTFDLLELDNTDSRPQLLEVQSQASADFVPWASGLPLNEVMDDMSRSRAGSIVIRRAIFDPCNQA
jgi:hypothetical protein